MRIYCQGASDSIGIVSSSFSIKLVKTYMKARLFRCGFLKVNLGRIANPLLAHIAQKDEGGSIACNISSYELNWNVEADVEVGCSRYIQFRRGRR